MWDDGLDAEQLAVAEHGGGPLVVVAGAGTGKTRALTARLAALVERGVSAERVLLLSFTRRAADDMAGRAAGLLAAAGPRRDGLLTWAGTFHSVAYRIVAAHADRLGLGPLSVLDPADAAVLMELLLEERRTGDDGARPPRPSTLVDLWSRAVNTGTRLAVVVGQHAPWLAPHLPVLGEVMAAYVARKREHRLVDFDDLLLAWRALLDDPDAGPAIRARWDHVLVDEYQDLNQLQVDIVTALRPGGTGLTVVGDEAQAVYGFRGAVPARLAALAGELSATVVTLQRSYRSRPPVVAVANSARPAGDGGLPVELVATRTGGSTPQLVESYDAAEEARAVTDAVLAAVAEGTRLRDQAVLVRAAHHSDLLELELTARHVPFRKYGGLRFLEAAHVKDFVACLRVVANPADEIAWFRLLRLHRGIGSASARALLGQVGRAADPEVVAAAPPRSRLALEGTLAGLASARGADAPGAQAAAALACLTPLVEARYEHSTARLGDLARLADAAAGAADLGAYVSDLTLDPPASTSDLAGPPHLDEDYLVVSTVHSAKGLEWSHVHVIGLVDGAFPSDMALSDPEGLAEEARLFYVAVTRARDALYLHVPLRLPHHRRGADDRHSLAPASRFVTVVAGACQRVRRLPARPTATAGPGTGRVGLPDLSALWS